MPWYEYAAACGCTLETYLPISQYHEAQRCTHGTVMERVIGAPLMVKVAQDIAYDSPIDGTVITSWHARQEDLKRHNCVPYDPEMKKDQERRLQEQDRQLDAAVDETVEAAVSRMPTRTRGRLYSELTEQGVDAQLVRSTKGA